MPENVVDILENDFSPEILAGLLRDHTTGRNILWCTHDYESKGEGYQYADEIRRELITGEHGTIIRPRVLKSKAEQSDRVKDMAEVFTPSWVVKMMVDYVDINVSTLSLELTCGEAPFLVSRYDATTGEALAISERVGLLDRKLRMVNEQQLSDDEWLSQVRLSFHTTYGYEWQGDSLLLARENLLYTFIDHYEARFGSAPDISMLQEFAEIISWNLWQMDGLTYCIPREKQEEAPQAQLDLFNEAPTEALAPYCRIMDWHHDRTITLSVTQLTTGVTIPEWSGVLMLCNMQSAPLYMQAAFRAQNPYEYSDGGKIVRKDNAYVFDFDPARTLMLYDEFANNRKNSTAEGNVTMEDRQHNIRQLLNFFPVIAEDDEGKMMQIDERQVLSIPRKIKCEEVVRRGFMSNLLFRNIANIFSAPSIVGEILKKLDKAHEERGRSTGTSLDEAEKVSVDDNGEVMIPEEVIIGQERQIFGDKLYKTFEEIEDDITMAAEGPDQVLKAINRMGDSLKAAIEQNIINPASEEYELTQAQTKRIVRDSQKELETKIEKIKGDFEQQRKIAEVKHEEACRQATNEKELENAENTLRQEMELALKGVNDAIKEATNDIINNKPKEVIERIEKDKEERRKDSVEEEVRAHLRGFARTIPSFIMAYDEGSLTLNNFDKNIEDDVFKEVTSITLEEFRFLRDGGDYTENGVQKHFNGHLFDEVVFDDAISEFRKKRQELANYFDESQTEDIFDYIPPQKTNQIFTPKWVVKKMVDLLEQENPHIFEDPQKTFSDLYMKSGLYITEIVRRLYNNVEMQRLIPDDHERIQHILRHQVYGFAPTRIIYLIATRYILGFDPSFLPKQSNFRQVDTVPYAKEGRMEELIEKEFGTLLGDLTE